jgi:signal transduction histidine kinase
MRLIVFSCGFAVSDGIHPAGTGQPQASAGRLLVDSRTDDAGCLPAVYPGREMTTSTDGLSGILAGVQRLETWLHVSLVLLTVGSSVRYLQAHGFGDRAPAVLAGAALLLALYAAYRRVPWRGHRWWPTVWCATLVATWLALVLAAPSFAWCAVPLAFVALRVLPFPVACLTVAGMVVVVIAAWTQMRASLDPTVILGPACVAVLAVTAYRALDREARTRQELLDALRDAQGDLADAQHRAGALAERARLSREIHDSVAQGLSSINLLLQAAIQDWEPRPIAAREHVAQAARSARDSLDEVRRVVRDLAPAELATDLTGAALPAMLREASARATRHTGLDGDVLVHGEPVPLPEEVATALLRTARGAVANVVEHADARRITVTLTYQTDLVSLDVRDDGRGFDPVRVHPSGSRGRGLAGIRSRARALGGELAVESAPGEGTTVALSLPLTTTAGNAS